MRIVYCLDENYVDMATVSILSFRRWNPTAKIIVVSENPLPKDMGYDQNIIITLPKKFRSRKENDRITNAAYLKCFLTELPFRKCLYVDPDTICQKPLRELYNIPVKYIGLTESHSYGSKQAQELGLEKYGITGMMLMNLDELRNINFTERCLNVEKNFLCPRKMWRHDETCINLGMKGLLTFVDKKYNYCHNREYYQPIPEEDAYILHYVGDGKKDMPKINRYPEIEEIGEQIRGKRVAIVGNAKSIFDKRNGKEIDSHEFVIRFNKGFIIKEESQGRKTNLLLLACELSKEELESYKADYICNRSMHYNNPTPFTIKNEQRALMKLRLGSQPSTGFMAIHICLNYGAESIDLYGFDFEKTPTFYNPIGYKTQHDYNKEEDIVRDYERKGLLKIK